MTADQLKELLIELIQIPSITGSEGENQIARHIYRWLTELTYFQKTPQHVRLLEMPNGNGGSLQGVLARMDALIPTKKTVLFVAHTDVVDTHVYGDLRESAFSPNLLARALEAGSLGGKALRDLQSGDYLFGRGCMDMKCGVALEMGLLADFSENRELFDANVLVAFVGDEENSAAGMRGMVPYIAAMLRDEQLQLLAAINTEPTEPGAPGQEGALVFVGTLGKLLPAFYVRGVQSHVGAYYHGFSAALVASHLIAEAEANPQLTDPSGGISYPSWNCLEMKLLNEGYSVTVPARALLYFNCFVTESTPEQIMQQMGALAHRALQRTNLQIEASFEALKKQGYRGDAYTPPSLRVLSYADLVGIVRERFEGDLEHYLLNFERELTEKDLRERGVRLLEELLRLSALEGALVVTAFLPPYLPSRFNSAESEKEKNALGAVEKLIREAHEEYGVELQKVDYYAGLCDLSYTGYQGSAEQLQFYADNMPGWGALFSLDIADQLLLRCPVLNLGPIGFEAHRKGERLQLSYSLGILPSLLVRLLQLLAKK